MTTLIKFVLTNAVVATALAFCVGLLPGMHTPVTAAEDPSPSIVEVGADDHDTTTGSLQPTWTFDRLPPTCDVLYKVASPDQTKVAFVGSNLTETGSEQHGLFVVELRTGSVRRLLEKAVKTVPAWSPDSRRLAIGNAAGYVTRYPLVLVDVETGQVEEKVGGASPEVDRHLNELRKRLDELETRPDETGQHTQIPMIPFGLGKKVPLEWPHSASPARRVRQLRFTVGETGKRFREMWVRPSVRLELQLDETYFEPHSAEPTQLVLYDDGGRPVHAFAIPLGAVDLLQRPAAEFVSRIQKCSSFWLKPNRTPLPDVSYTFHESEDKHGDYSIRDESNPHFVRGVTMNLALDAILWQPVLWLLTSIGGH